MHKINLFILVACLMTFSEAKAQSEKPKVKVDKSVLDEGAKADVYRMDKSIFDSSDIKQKPALHSDVTPVRNIKKVKKKYKKKVNKKSSK